MRLDLTAVERVYRNANLAPEPADAITLEHRCPACGGQADTVEFAPYRFSTYCRDCEITGPRGFEAAADLIVRRTR